MIFITFAFVFEQRCKTNFDMGKVKREKSRYKEHPRFYAQLAHIKVLALIHKNQQIWQK